MNERIKLRLFLIVLFHGCVFGLEAQKLRVEVADSLFTAQKYTEALNEFERVYQQGYNSPSMLLKMAYIQDGLGNYAEALTYLDRYYMLSADREVVGKIKEISDEQSLKGYSYSDIHYFQALLWRNKLLLMTLLGGLAALLLVVIYRSKSRESRPLVPAFLQLITLLALLFLVNFSPSPYGIINTEETLLRSGPSAGAEPIERIKKGNKVEILDEGPVWTKIEWEGREGYIRNARVSITS